MKEFLSQKGVEFTDRDVTKDPEALRELTEGYGVFSTPVVMVNDELVIGFDREKLEQLLGI